MYALTKLAKHKVVLGMVAAILFGLALAPSTAFGKACTIDTECAGGEVCTDKVCVAVAGDTSEDTFGLKGVNTGLEDDSGNNVLGNKDLRETIGDLIQVALSLLGVVAVVIILIGGFKWMTAGGNEEKVTEARKLIFSGIIGLAVILSAWAISIFVIEQLSTATGSGDVPSFE